MADYKWTQVFPATTPAIYPADYQEILANDPTRDRMILFGFNIPGSTMATYEYYSGDWHLVTTAAKPAYTSYQMAGVYDETNSNLVGLFHKLSGTRETWTYNGTNWTNKAPATQPPVQFLEEGQNLAYDGANNNVVAFGRAGAAANPATWIWNGTTWSNASPATQPAYRAAFAFCWDPANGNCVLHGGSHGAPPNYTDTWIWNGTTWSNASPATTPTVAASIRMTFDATIGKVVMLLATAATDETWLWDGTDWEQATVVANLSPIRARTSVAYDTEVGKTMGWGGSTGPTLLYETWFFERVRAAAQVMRWW